MHFPILDSEKLILRPITKDDIDFVFQHFSDSKVTQYLYDLAAPYWGQGYMKEALKVVIEYGFTQMKLNRIDALVAIENDRSSNLLKSLGFKQEGILRDYFYLNGKFYDHSLFSLLQKEWIV